MEIGTKVKVFTPFLLNHTQEGEVIKEGIGLNGLILSKVKFSKNTEVWYADHNLKTVTSDCPEQVVH